MNISLFDFLNIRSTKCTCDLGTLIMNAQCPDHGKFCEAVQNMNRAEEICTCDREGLTMVDSCKIHDKFSETKKTMNLIEAIKSGKPFRAIGKSKFMLASDFNNKFDCADLMLVYELKTEPREWDVGVSGCGNFITSNKTAMEKTIRVREILE